MLRAVHAAARIAVRPLEALCGNVGRFVRGELLRNVVDKDHLY